MIVRGGTGLRQALWLIVKRNQVAIIAVLAIEFGALTLHEALPDLKNTAFSAAAVGVLATIVGIFVAFRFNEAYNRWWEARILWGGLVNVSRTFARQVTTLLTPDRVTGLTSWDDARAVHRELLNRHLAYVNSIRLQLRGQPLFPEIDPYLEFEERKELQSARNAATQLNQKQGVRLATILGTDTAESIILTQIDSSLVQMINDQGGVERIKNTAFPDRVIITTRILVWVVAVLVAISFIEPQLGFNWVEFLAVLIMVLSFLLVRQLGEELNDPFDNQPNDTPMTALCRTIEIDLRQHLKDENVPEPLEPVNGILM